MWKHEARRRYVKYESIGLEQWVDMPTLIRDDGVSLALMGQGREKKIEFVYTDGGISFKFTATRYFDEGTVQTDTWTALLGEVFERLEKQSSNPVPASIADNIREGLLAWPWYGEIESAPAKSVVIDQKRWRNYVPGRGYTEYS